MGKPTFQSGPVFGVQRVQTVNDKFPILKVWHQPPPHQCGYIGIESRQTVEGVGNIDILWGGIRVRRGLWFVFGSIRTTGLNSDEMK